MGLIKEIKTFEFEVFLEKPIMHFKAFDNNSISTDITRLPKILPQSKHINIVFRHLHEYISKVFIHIQQVFTNYQFSGAWNKPLPQTVLLKHCKIIFGFYFVTHISPSRLN